MSSRSWTVTFAVLAVLGIGAAFFQTRQLQKTRVELAESKSTADGLRQKAFESDKVARTALNTSAAIIRAQTSPAASAASSATLPQEPVTADLVRERQARAKALAMSGQNEEALREYLWLFDEGMVRVSSMSGVRVSFLLAELGKLGENYPAALDALRSRRDAAEKRMLASANDSEATSDFAAINRTLGEASRNLATMDSLPENDRRRVRLASASFNELVAARRYQDALGARDATRLLSSFDDAIKENPYAKTLPNPEEFNRSLQMAAIKSAMQNLEVLAGANDLENARKLSAKVLAVDGSDQTRTQINEAFTRGGHPDITVP